MTDLDDRFEAYVFAPKRERIVQKWRVIQCQFVTLFSGNGISKALGGWLLGLRQTQRQEQTLCPR